VIAAAVALACLLGVIYRRRAVAGGLPDALFAGSALTLFLLAGISLGPSLLADTVAIALGYGVTALALSGRIPQGAVAMFAVYLPILLSGLRPDASTERIAVDALFLIPMLGLFMWRQQKIAASSAIAAAAVAGALELAKQGRGEVAVAVLIGTFVVAAVAYEIRIRFTGDSTLRAFSRLGIPVLLVYLFVWSLDFSTTIFGGGDAPWWISALAVSLYEAFRVRKDSASFPMRLIWVAFSVGLAVTQDSQMMMHFKLLTLLAIAGILQLGSIKAASKALSNVAVLTVVGVAVSSLMFGTNRYGANVLAVGVLTFSALLLLHARPALPVTPAPPGVAPEQTSFLKRVFLVALGTLLRLPFIAWIFFWIKTSFTWLKYFKSPDESFGVNDLLLAGAHIYGVVLVTRQLEFYLADAGASDDATAVASNVVCALWGLAVTVRGVRRREIYQRMLGISIILVPTTMNLLAATGKDDGVFGWLLLCAGIATWVASWLVLRERKST